MNSLAAQLPLWEEAKRLTYLIDKQTPFSPPGLREDESGVYFMESAGGSRESERFHELLYGLGVVAPEHAPHDDFEPPSRDRLRSASAVDLENLITWVCRSDRFVEGTLADAFNQGVMTDAFRHLYRSRVCGADGWPSLFPRVSAGQVREGMVVTSLNGAIQGRTTGSRSKCKATGCPGWFIGVLWETGQQTYICSEGWHYDAATDGVRVVGGGEISARFVSPKPLGIDPLPRDQWPAPDTLYRRKGWRLTPHSAGDRGGSQ